MKKIEFSNPQEVVDYLESTALRTGLEAAEFQKEVIFNTVQEAVNESDEPQELDPDDFDYAEVAEGVVGDYMEDVVIVYKGKELNVADPDGIFYLAGVALSWLYSCFEYDEDEEEATNTDGWLMSDAVKNYAWGYLAAMEKYID